jgi:hypothetical protein
LPSATAAGAGGVPDFAMGKPPVHAVENEAFAVLIDVQDRHQVREVCGENLLPLRNEATKVIPRGSDARITIFMFPYPYVASGNLPDELPFKIDSRATVSGYVCVIRIPFRGIRKWGKYLCFLIVLREVEKLNRHVGVAHQHQRGVPSGRSIRPAMVFTAVPGSIGSFGKTGHRVVAVAGQATGMCSSRKARRNSAASNFISEIPHPARPPAPGSTVAIGDFSIYSDTISALIFRRDRLPCGCRSRRTSGNIS